MYKPNFLLAFAVSGLLLLALPACDYSTPEGGTLDVRLNSTSSSLDLSKAVVTVEHVSIASKYDGSEPKRFDGWPNMIEENQKVDLTSVTGSGDMRLTRDQVPHGDFDGLNIKFSETAQITYQDENGESVTTTASLPEEINGRVALKFDSLVLSEGESATVSLKFDLGGSFSKKEKDAFKFQPSLNVEELVVNGEKQAL
jgi:hypothetical protein